MVTFTERPHAASFILSEANGQRSRENVEIAAGQGPLPPGTVVKAGVPYTGGAGPDLAITIYGFDTTSTGTNGAAKVACIKREAEVNRHCIAWPDSFDDTDIDAACVELAKQMIIVRGAALASPTALREGEGGPGGVLLAGDPERIRRQSPEEQRLQKEERRQEAQRDDDGLSPEQRRQRDEDRQRQQQGSPLSPEQQRLRQQGQFPAQPPGPGGPAGGGEAEHNTKQSSEPNVQRPGDAPLKS